MLVCSYGYSSYCEWNYTDNEPMIIKRFIQNIHSSQICKPIKPNYLKLKLNKIKK